MWSDCLIFSLSAWLRVCTLSFWHNSKVHQWLPKYFWEGGYNITRTICGCIKALDFIPVFFGHESVNKQNIVPLFPHELSGSCWSCHNVSDVWQRSPVARPGPGCSEACMCAHTWVHVFLNTELTSSICVLGVCGARGHSLIDCGACERWTFRQLCVPLCTSATLSQLRNNTPCSLRSPTALQCEAHTRDPLHLLVPIYNAEDGGCFNLQFINEASWHSSGPYVLSIVPRSHRSMRSIYVSLN